MRRRPPPIASAGQGLRLLREELRRSILTALATRPMTEVEIEKWLVIASRNTLRKHLGELLRAGAIERRDLGGVPRRVEYRLTPAGYGLLGLIETVTRWLVGHPDRPLEPVSPVGWRAFGALADAWRAAIVEALASSPSTAAGLRGAIAGLSKSKIERDLRRLVGAGLAEETTGEDGERYFTLSDWGCRSIGILAVAARWEATYLPEGTVPLSAADAVAALLAALRLIRLPESRSGICVLTAEAEPAEEQSPGSRAVWAEIDRDRVVLCAEGRSPRPPTCWARGSFEAWFEAVVDGRPEALQMGGDTSLSREVLRQLHVQLYNSD